MEFVTLTELKAFLKIVDDDDDSNLQSIVDMVNDFIPLYCHRDFSKVTYNNELYDGPGTNSLVLRNRPVISIMKVIDNGAEISERTDIDSEGYYYKDLREGILYNDSLWSRGRGKIMVSYVAGYENPPADLKYAALELAAYARNVKAKAGIVAESLGSYSYRVAVGLENIGQELTIPNVIVKNILDRYRDDYITDYGY